MHQRPKGILRRSTSLRDDSSENNVTPPPLAACTSTTALSTAETLVSRPDDDMSDPETRRPKVQFPERLDKPSPYGPYPFVRQDSEVSSSYPPSLAGDDDSEDYDWSDEEDLVDESIKFEQRMGNKIKATGWGAKRVLSLLFSSLIGSTLLATVFITPALLVHFFWYKAKPTEHRAFVRDNVQAWLFWVAVNLPLSWCFAMIIDLAPILASYLVLAIWGHVSESIKTKIETYNSVKNTAKPCFYAASAYASWAVIFNSIYQLHSDDEESRASYTDRIYQVVQFGFFLTLVWCGQRMLSHFIAFSFHRTAYKDRIEFVEKALGVIEKLSRYRPKHTRDRSGFRTPTGFSGLSTPLSQKQHYNLLSKALRNATPYSRPGTPPPNVTAPPSRGEPFSTGDLTLDELDRKLVEQRNIVAQKAPWFNQDPVAKTKVKDGQAPPYPDRSEEVNGFTYPRSVFSPETTPPNHTYPPRYQPSEFRTHSPRPSVDGVEAPLKQAAKAIKTAVLHDARNILAKDEETDFASMSWNVNSSHEAKRLARSLWKRFKDRGRTWLIPADFYPAFPNPQSAEDAFRVFDKDGNGDISRAEIKTVLLKVYRERRFLSRSMRDVGEALVTLNNILRFFAAVVLFFISLSVFGVEVGDSLTSVYTVGIAASFIFKNAASSAFDSIMFLFVTHPYDTGDRVFVDAENLVVKKVGLFATVFSRYDGTETYYFNAQLFNKFIVNVRRSGKTAENLWMQVAWKTPLTKLDALEKCINDWLSTEENRWFEPSTNITLQHIKYQRYLELTIGIGHNGNWQDWGLRNARKTAFHAAVQYYCRQLGIIGYEAPLPVVWVDQQTMKPEINPLADDGISLKSPLEPDQNLSAEQQHRERVEVEEAAKQMKPTLGFLPPLADRSSHLTRARKSKHKRVRAGVIGDS